MARFIVNGLSEDDGVVYDTWEMTHPTIDEEHKLQADWETSFDEVISAEPKEWDANDILDKMEEKGWSVERVDAVKVWY
jgi:hypothetical protein